MSTPAVTDNIWDELVQRRAQAIRFGVIHISIQDNRVTHIETAVRTRLAVTDALSSVGEINRESSPVLRRLPDSPRQAVSRGNNRNE